MRLRLRLGIFGERRGGWMKKSRLKDLKLFNLRLLYTEFHFVTTFKDEMFYKQNTSAILIS